MSDHSLITVIVLFLNLLLFSVCSCFIFIRYFMANCLVTGGAGFIGAHVADELLRLGANVSVLDDLSGGFEDNIPSGASFYRGSITDATFVDSVFKKSRFDFVFHLAAYAAEGLSHFIKRFNYTNNLIGTVNLINNSVNHNVRAFVFTSSIAVYGTGQLPMDEETVPVPEDSYGIAKLAAEMELRASSHMFGLPYIIFRPHNVYGEKQNLGDPYRNVIGIFMNNIMQDKPMTIFGDGTQTRAFSHISDVAPIIASSIDNIDAYNQIFNVGADQPHSVSYLAQVVAQSMQTEPKIISLPARNEVLHAYSSHEKVNRYFKTKPPMSLEDGIALMAKWAKTKGPRTSKPFEQIEITKNLPASWQKLIRQSV